MTFSQQRNVSMSLKLFYFKVFSSIAITRMIDFSRFKKDEGGMEGRRDEENIMGE